MRSSLLGQVDVRDQLDVAARALSGGFFPYRQRSRSLGGSELVGQNSGRERNSLIRAEISLIADLNSLQGRKKFPVRMLGNWAVKY